MSNTNFGIWSEEEDEIIKNSKKGNMTKYYMIKPASIVPDVCIEQDIGWRWCKDEMPNKAGHYLTQLEPNSDPINCKFNGSEFIYFHGDAYRLPNQWLNAPPTLNEEKSAVFGISTGDNAIALGHPTSELDNLKKRVGELEAKAGKKRSFNALVIAHRDLIKKMNEILEEDKG